MSKLNKKLENFGEILKANIIYDLNSSLDAVAFFKALFEKRSIIKENLDKNLNRKITSDDKL